MENEKGEKRRKRDGLFFVQLHPAWFRLELVSDCTEAYVSVYEEKYL